MSGFPTRGGANDTNPVMLGQSIALIGQPVSGDYLPVGTTINRSEYLTLSDAYPNIFAMQKTAVAVTYGYPWAGIAYGNGIYVAVGGGCGRVSGYDLNTNTQSVITSTDGINWATQSNVLPASQYWSGVAFGNGVFVAVSATVSGSIAYSTDGVSWTGVSGVQAHNVAFGNGIFVLFGINTVVWTSTDGINWTARTYGNYSTTWGCAFLNGKFWRTVSSNVIQYSTDGISWGTSTLPSNVAWGRICWNGSMYLVASTSSTAYATSTDGVTWTGRTLAGTNGCVCTIGSMFVAFSAITSSSTAYFSTDGITWTSFSAWPKVYCLFSEAGRAIVIPQSYATGYICVYGQSITITLTGTSGQYVRVR